MNELYHHGIKGQKWGIRRYQNPDGSLTDLGKKRIVQGTNLLKEKGVSGVRKVGKFVKNNKAEIQTYKENKKRIHEMSDHEIRQRINRIEMERKLTNLEKPKIVRGAETVKNIMGRSANTVAGTVVTAAGVYAVKKYIESKWGVDVVKDMFPKKK